jgi:hypothetical protein
VTDKDKEEKPAEPAGVPAEPKPQTSSTTTPDKDKAGADVKPPEADKPAAGPASAPTLVSSAARPASTPDAGTGAEKPAADDTVRDVPSPKPPADIPIAAKGPLPELAMSKGTGSLPGAERMGGTGQSSSTPAHVLDRKATYRRWLESKSKEDLVELIMGLEKEQPALEVTDKMMKVQLTGPLAAPVDSFKIPDDLPFLRLPVVRRLPPNEPTPTWHIVLVSLEQNNKPVGLIIDSEITIGRTAGGAVPDFDLTPFGASLKGVSRIHAKLRPTMHSLTLVDNNSSNGTYCNRSRIAPDTEQPLKEGDVIAFGQAYFLVRVVKSPDASEAKTLI